VQIGIFLALVGQFKTRVKGAFLRPMSAKKAKFTHERVEYNFFLIAFKLA
jgi:hypothetical protein